MQAKENIFLVCLKMNTQKMVISAVFPADIDRNYTNFVKTGKAYFCFFKIKTRKEEKEIIEEFTSLKIVLKETISSFSFATNGFTIIDDTIFFNGSLKSSTEGFYIECQDIFLPLNAISFPSQTRIKIV